MGFLDFWQKKKREIEPLEEQTDLFYDSQQLPPQRRRIDGAIVYRCFTDSIKSSGGTGGVYADAVVAETEELFDCSVEDLYSATGGTINRRHTLPREAQRAYIVNESLTAWELDRLNESINGDNDEINDQIVDVVRDQSRQTRRWLPW